MIWTELVQFCDDACEFLSEKCEIHEEPEMAKFNQKDKGWLNIIWKNESIRRAHIDVVDARETKGLWMMHLCIFPQLHNSSPIYGFDVIAGKNKITGLFHDFSPVCKDNKLINETFKMNTSQYNPSKKRNLPDWAKKIFSNDMVAVGNIRSHSEISKLLNICTMNLKYYMNIVPLYNNSANKEKILKAQNYYCENQQKNPHTPKVMKSLGLNEEDVEMFCNHLLFPKIGEENETI